MQAMHTTDSEVAKQQMASLQQDVAGIMDRLGAMHGDSQLSGLVCSVEFQVTPQCSPHHLHRMHRARRHMLAWELVVDDADLLCSIWVQKEQWSRLSWIKRVSRVRGGGSLCGRWRRSGSLPTAL